jgi:hypothetical protein
VDPFSSQKPKKGVSEKDERANPITSVFVEFKAKGVPSKKEQQNHKC